MQQKWMPRGRKKERLLVSCLVMAKLKHFDHQLQTIFFLYNIYIILMAVLLVISLIVIIPAKRRHCLDTINQQIEDNEKTHKEPSGE